MKAKAMKGEATIACTVLALTMSVCFRDLFFSLFHQPYIFRPNGNRQQKFGALEFQASGEIYIRVLFEI